MLMHATRFVVLIDLAGFAHGLAFLYRFSLSHYDTYSNLVWRTNSGITGILLFVVMIIMYAGKQSPSVLCSNQHAP